MMQFIKCEICGYKSKKEEDFIADETDHVYCRECYSENRHRILNTVQTGEF